MRCFGITLLALAMAGLTWAQGDNMIIGNVDGKRVKCLTCRETVREIIVAQSKVDPRKKAEVKAGRFRVDGSPSGQLIEFRKSEQYLTELFEGDEGGVCDKIDDYAKAKFKSNGTLIILKMMLDNGGMNPLMSEVDFVQDQDLNKSLKHYCLEVLDEFDEVFLDYFMAPELPEDVVDLICTDRSKLCKKRQAVDKGNEDQEDDTVDDEQDDEQEHDTLLEKEL